MHKSMIYNSATDSVEIKDSAQQERHDATANIGVGPVTDSGLPMGDSGFNVGEQLRLIQKDAERIQEKLDANTYDPRTGLATPVYTGQERERLEREMAQLAQSYIYQTEISRETLTAREAAQGVRAEQLASTLERQERNRGLTPEQQDEAERIGLAVLADTVNRRRG